MSVLTLAMFRVFKFCFCKFVCLFSCISFLVCREMKSPNFLFILLLMLQCLCFCIGGIAVPSCYAVSQNQMCSLGVVMGYQLCEQGNRDLIHGRSRHIAVQNQDSYWCPVDIMVFKAWVKQPGRGTDSHSFCNSEVKMRGAIHFQGMVLNLYQIGLVFKLQHIVNDKSMNVS